MKLYKTAETRAPEHSNVSLQAALCSPPTNQTKQVIKVLITAEHTKSHLTLKQQASTF